MESSSGQASRALLVGRNLAVDAVTAEVVKALHAAGVRSLLLRGPAIAQWLYAGEAEQIRTYEDLDLLVPPEEIDRCHRALEAIGFVNRFAAFAPGETAEHSSEWWRQGSIVAVDLHRTLQGVRADSEALWSAMSADTEMLAVADTEVEVPTEPARALVVVIHAAHHGIAEPKPLRDLELLLDRADPSLWQESARLAERLEATPAFAAGLLLRPEGARIAERLGISDAVDTEAALLSRSAGPTAFGYARLAAIPGLRRKLAFLLRNLVPTAGFMRYAYPIARRGRVGLLLAYLWRPLWLLGHAGPDLAAWLRARR